MGQVLHGSAKTTHAIRAAIQRSQASIKELSERYDLNPKTVAKWKKRDFIDDAPMGPKDVHSTVLSVEEEALAVAFRKHTLLPLDDCLYALQATIPQLTRSSLHRCLQRHGMSRLPDMAGDRPKKRFKTYPIGYFHIDIAEVRTEEGRLYLFVAVDRTSKFAHAELREKATRKSRRLSCKRSSRSFPTGSTRFSPTTESSSPICPGTAPARPRDTAFTCSTGSATSMASSTG